MPSIDFARVRAQVTDFWSGEPVSNASLVRKAAEHTRSPGFPSYPRLDKEQAREFEFEAEDRYFRVHFLKR